MNTVIKTKNKDISDDQNSEDVLLVNLSRKRY